MTQNTCWN